MKRYRSVAILLAAAFFWAGCSDQATSPEMPEALTPEFALTIGTSTAQATLADMNAALAESGADYQVGMVEWYTDPESGQVGNTVFFNDRGNKQVGSHFVPNDARRAWSGGGSSISFVTDAFDGGTATGLTAADTDAAIQSAMSTWNNQNCSNLPISYGGSAPFDIGFVQSLLGFGGSLSIIADVAHAGFLPGLFFDFLAPGGSNFILGVTFTFNWTGGDSNNDGKSDTAFREIYYNDNFPWAVGADFDVETVALHEAGHALSQAHFGKAFANKSGVHFAPRAVMNAAYSGIQQAPTGTDNGGHCSIWGSWPNN